MFKLCNLKYTSMITALMTVLERQLHLEVRIAKMKVVFLLGGSKDD